MGAFYKMIEYKLTEGQEDVPMKDRKIEEHGHVPTFTFNELENNIFTLEKGIKEIKANILVQEAKKRNVEEHHPFIKDMSLEDVTTVAVYHEAVSFINKLQTKLNEFEEVYKKEVEAREKIEEAIPGINPVETPSAEVVDGEVKINEQQ